MNMYHTIPLNQQCLVCATEALQNYIDLTLVTSQTTHSETPVEDKLRNILGDRWREPEPDMAMVICVPCFSLIDQFDALETQLSKISRDITQKYVNSFGRDKIPPSDKTKLQRKRRGRPPKSPNKVTPTRLKIKDPTKPKRKYTKRKKPEKEEEEDSESETDLLWIPNADDDRDSSPGPSQNQQLDLHQQLAVSENGTKVRKESLKARAQLQAQTQSSSGDEYGSNDEDMHEPQPHPPKEKEPEKPNNNIYDEALGLLNQGERLRLGVMIPAEDGSLTYGCAYCDESFVDTGMLLAHVRVRHRPEPLTTLLPVDMGFGTRVNCGVQLYDVTSSHELGKPFVCIFCDGAFKFKSNVLLHYKEKHTPYKPFTCLDCKESFRRSMELSRHRVYYCPFRKRKVPKKRGREPKNTKKE